MTSETGASPVVKNDRQKGKEWSPWTAIDHYGPRVGEKVAPASYWNTVSFYQTEEHV